MTGEAFGLPAEGTPQEPVDETPQLDEASFSLDTWIRGIQPTIRSVTLYGRADVLAQIDELERQIKLARAAGPEGEQGLDEETPAGLQTRLEELYETFSASALTFRVQGRSDQWREDADKRLKKAGVTDETERTLRALADSIVSPAGITYEHLAHLQDVSEPQIKMLLVAYAMANHTPPRVDVPFSHASSAKTGGRKSS